MATSVNPVLSPFVRGTTDASQTYFLSAGTRRLIPDAPTLALLLAGQSVLVLSDADLAAVPIGTPLPSRKDGTLLTQKYTVPPPGIVVYFIAAGQRRRILDIQTQTGLVSRGSQIIPVELADLSAIPEGAPLPTRNDGTLYQGPGKPYAFLIKGGQKIAYPDATTLAQAGFDFHALLPITAADLSLIPDGTAVPSASQFIAPPSSQVPLVLLPVRLETRFQKQNAELWLRVYPDDIHVNSFEPNLTIDEQTARSGYLALSASDTETRRAAFAALARQFGAARTAWITSANVPSAVKPADWTIAPFTNVLPERWIVIGYQGKDQGQVLAVGPAIQDTLAVAPLPNGSGPVTDDGTKWITDFDRAVQAGMAFRITLSPTQQTGFTRLLVLGLRSTLSPADSVARLNDLLQAHHYTDGLELLAQGTPTNNTEDVSSGHGTQDPDYSQLFALEQGPALCPSRPTADGDRLARALGISPTTLAHVKGSDGAQDEQAHAMNTVLWPGTWGYYLSQIVTGATPNPQIILPAARDHFVDHVRARGHYRALRIGRQPYGLLPVCYSGGWKSLEGRALDAPLYGLLTRLRTIWAKSIAHVPRVPNSPDPEASLVDILAMTPSSTSTVARGVIGPEYTFAYWSFIGKDLPTSWWTTLAQSTLVNSSTLAAAMAKTRLASSTYLKEHRPLTDILVASDPLDPSKPPDFIGQLVQASAAGWQALRDATLPAAPVPMLFLLLRHSALREYMDTALDLLTAANPAQASERVEPEMVNFAGAVLRPSAWDLLQSTLSGRGMVGTVLDNSKSDPTLPSFVAYWKAFAQLAQFSSVALDAAARDVLDLASYRLDAWITSLAHFRLDSLRTSNPAGSIVIGGYGWLENVRPQPQLSSQGFVHAPSLRQSTTAAVLRSGYLTHQGGPQRPFEIDLSSARVRLALHLLDGIREGQPLGALLGYRLERTLNDNKHGGLVSKARAAFPLQSANQLDVVDGLALARTFHSDPNTFWSKVGIPSTGADGIALSSAAGVLYDALDALADLTLAESVHQLTQGNMLRAGATLDSIARGDTPPPEIDFVKTPRSGTALTFRLMTIATGNSAPGWSVTPRAQAEPRLNSWAAALLGDPSRVRIRVRFTGPDGTALSNLEIGLNQLGLAAMDVLSFPETQGISGELADRIRRVAFQMRPASVPASAFIDLVAERDPAWSPQTVGVAEWLALLQAITRMAGGARALEPADLVAQGDTPGVVDTSELQSRADLAESQLRSVFATLQNPSNPDAALMGAAGFGAVGAIPSSDPSSWPAQIAAAVADISARVQILDQLAAGFVRVSASADALQDHDVARLKAVFGPSFLVLPAISAATSAAWPQLWANSASLQGGDTFASIRWLQRASRVRAGVGRMDKAIMYAEGLAGGPLLQLQIAQLPYTAGEKWVGLDVAGQLPGSRLSLAAFSPTAFVSGAAIAGLMIDEWIEVWPSSDQITGVSFQYSDPVARAPQAILLAVPPDDFPEWTLASVQNSIVEAFELAKLRGVDPDIALGTIPPRQVDANVKAFQALSETEMFVLGKDGNLWLEHAPFGTVPPTREQVDANVSAFQALSDTQVLVQSTDGRLWLEQAPFGTVPPRRQQVDAGQPTLPLPPVQPTTTTVPDLRETSPAIATKMLQAVGLVASIQGVVQGMIVMSSQSPAANQVVKIGTVVTVHYVKGPKVPQ